MDWPWSETTVSVSTSPYKPTALLSRSFTSFLCSSPFHSAEVLLIVHLATVPLPRTFRGAGPRAGEWWSSQMILVELESGGLDEYPETSFRSGL